MDLKNAESLWLSTRTPRELIAMIRAQKEWDEATVQSLDGAVTSMTGATLARTSPSLDELEDYQAILLDAAQHLPEDAAAREYYLARWSGLSDCLRIRSQLIEHGSYDAVRHMRHLPEILEALHDAGSEGLNQSELQETLGLQAANLTRILNTLENHRIVVRERKGKEKRVMLGANAPAPTNEKHFEGARIFFPPQRTGTHG